MTPRESEICKELSALYEQQQPFVDAEKCKTVSHEQIEAWAKRREGIRQLEDELLGIRQATQN